MAAQVRRAGQRKPNPRFYAIASLPERMKRQMRRFLHRTERNKANLVGLAHLLKRPATARIPRQSPAAIGDRSNAVMVMVIARLLLGRWITPPG